MKFNKYGSFCLSLNVKEETVINLADNCQRMPVNQFQECLSVEELKLNANGTQRTAKIEDYRRSKIQL